MATDSVKKHTYTVLVTGFGANKVGPYGNFTSNPAGDIAKMMPHSMTVQDPLNSSGFDIDILDGVKGGWAAIEGMLAARPVTKDLHDRYGGKVDLWIHLGRGPWEHVTCERRAYRQDFTSSWMSEKEHRGYYLGHDDIGRNVNDLGPCPWMHVPMGLNSEVDINAVVVNANSSLKNHSAQDSRSNPLEVKSHVEAGSAGCGFIFYESMANCFAAGRRRDVLFIHVPRHEDEAALKKARDAVLAIVSVSIASIVQRDAPKPMSAQVDPKAPEEWKVKFGEQL